MSDQSNRNGDCTFEVKELLEIRTRCTELRKEKDMLRDSQTQGFELIRKLEEHVQTLSGVHSEDKQRIQELERELDNCSQEIDYLQDQLTLRNSELNMLCEEVCSLKLKLEGMEILEEETGRLKEELEITHADRLILMQKLENKELELQSSTLLIEKLEESISSMGLEYQCEIESLKLDLTALEQNCFESKKSQENSAQENARMNALFHDLELRFQDAENFIEYLEKENGNLREQLQIYEKNAKVFCQNVEEQFPQLLVTGNEEALENNASSCGDILGPLFTKLAILGASDVHFKEKTDKMSHQIQKYESLVEKLKEELKLERLTAKEEAEDLAQEMAELRYQMTGLLEEERKRRACIEQVSLQRIAKLEAQLEKERKKSFVNEEQSKAITTLNVTEE
ncbi:uncharacterized protein LOC116021680 [Ipomoea triloba]|uniref:uncharacterized protein LOC116021680 n=1 Tax=Ipomoea triloba TaxID=35885 RepID=UPI00125E5506|nr:uncharacterized protein LOC116021680 [Ipomoea triloba]XP_031118005.1 uncharacterized protein LOC116021680 [Ipomoea triloba]